MVGAILQLGLAVFWTLAGIFIGVLALAFGRQSSVDQHVSFWLYASPFLLGALLLLLLAIGVLLGSVACRIASVLLNLPGLVITARYNLGSPLIVLALCAHVVVVVLFLYPLAPRPPRPRIPPPAPRPA